jgi:uncharacterized membrane protein YphA (DoxX/SURF4 family)
VLTAKGGARVVTAVLALAVAVVGLLALVGSRSAGPAGASGRTVASAPAPNRAVAPAVTKLSAGDEPGPDEVLAGVYISNIQSVNLTTNSFDADFYVWLRWRNPDLDPTAGVEVMNPYMAWGLVVTPVYDQPQRQSDGSLLWLCRYQGSFNAPLSLSDYPFERQNLRIIIEDGIGTAQRVVYRPDADPVKIDPEVTLPGYHIGVPQIVFGEFTYESSFGEVQNTRESRTYPRITVDIPLSSPAASGIVKTILPIVIILIAGGLALVIPVVHAEAKIGLAITALLALVAMHWGVSATLPEAGYLLMIDVLYLLAYAAVTAVLSVTIAGVWVVRSKGEQAATTMERRMLVVIGAAVLVGLIVVLLLYRPEI